MGVAKKLAEKYRLEFEICGVPKLLLNYRGHWRAVHAEKKKWRLKVLEAVKLMGLSALPSAPLNSAAVILVRQTARQCDYDNRVSSFKSLLDALVEVGILADDSDNVIKRREYPWIKCANKDSKIKIIVEEI